MKRLLPIFKISSLVLVAFFFMSNRGGTPGGRTGSTTDGGGTCGTNGGCHAGGGELISQDFLSGNDSASYVPGDTMTIAVSPVRLGVNVWGFEMMAEDANGNPVGEFVSNEDANAIQSGVRATHKFTSSMSTDSALWNVMWIGPEAGTGDVTFYASALAANGDGRTGGDRVLVNTLVLNEDAITLSTGSSFENIDISLYPNPAVNTLKIEGATKQIDRISVFNSQGVNLVNSEFQSSLDVSNWASGVYYVKLQSGNKSITKTVLKK